MKRGLVSRSSSVLCAQVNGQRRGILVDEAAQAAGHLLPPKMGFEMRLHMILPRHLLVAEQADELGLPGLPQHRLGAALKGRHPWNSRTQVGGV